MNCPSTIRQLVCRLVEVKIKQIQECAHRFLYHTERNRNRMTDASVEKLDSDFKNTALQNTRLCATGISFKLANTYKITGMAL